MKIGIACRYTYQHQPARSIVHSDALLELLKRNMPIATAPNIGDGSLERPFRPTSIGAWFWLSQQRSRQPPMFILVGGRLIARWGTGGGQYVDYCTDVTDFVDLVTQYCLGGDDYEDMIAQEIGKWYALYDQLSGLDPRLPSYTRKALRIGDLDDREAAAISRGLLQGTVDCGECEELASSVCALFISESHRVPAMFAISLMLLDLVETSTTYGSGGGKRYTWKSMLMYNTGGIPGRGGGLKVLGKHPMAGLGTVALGARLFTYNDGDNLVRDRTVSILSVWLTHYLALKYGGEGYTYFIVDAPGHTKWTGRRMPEVTGGNAHLSTACRNAIRDRCTSLAVQIGGTTVYYENLAGDRV